MNKLFLLLTFTSLINAADIDATYENIILFQETGTLIDIRPPNEWQKTGVIPKAKTIVFFNKSDKNAEKVFVAKLQKYGIDSSRPIGLISSDGITSKKAQKILHDKMKMDVVNFTGGYKNISKHKDVE